MAAPDKPTGRPQPTGSPRGLDAVPAEPPEPQMPRSRLLPLRVSPAQQQPVSPGERVALRQLIIATDDGDFQLPAWQRILDRVGTPYDILYARRETVSADRLIRSDGVGRYNAILLTSGGLLVADDVGRFASALDQTGWESLWDYERTFGVRQVALNAAPGGYPEDYGLHARTEGAVGETPVLASLTGAGEKVFDYLNPAVGLPISGTYLYRTAVAPGRDVQPLLTSDSDVVGVLSTAPDGRERAALTFVLGELQLVTDLVGYGLLRWATRGIFLGEERHWISVDVDDWFNVLDCGPAGAQFRLSAPEAAAVSDEQAELRERYPVAAGFALNIAYNGNDIDLATGPGDAEQQPETLTSCSRRLRGEFRWVNHTLTHPQMNFTSYHENYREIRNNLAAAAVIGLPVPRAVLKTPTYSGLGVYNPDARSLDPPTDYGLMASNKALLQAAGDLGVRYLHGDMSFASHQPGCFNCGIRHPLRPDLMVVPDWPTNIAFDATTPQQQVSRYNAMYGASGTLQRSGRDFSYEEFLAAEADLALGHLISGSAYTHTLHQTNLHQYAPGRCLAFDWLDALLAAYSGYYRVPLKSPDWLTLATYVRDRTAHFAALATGRDAVWDRATGAVSYTPAADTALFVTGLATRPAADPDQRTADEAEEYGSDSVCRLGLAGGAAVAVKARPGS
jgi:hypothetical protein